MGDLLNALHHLQSIEIELSTLRQEQERRSKRIRAVQRQIDKLDTKLAALKSDKSARQAEADRLEHDIQARETTILKHREELLHTRTNKDYAAILTAINTEKADTSKVEQAALQTMGQLERVQEDVEACNQEREKQVERLAVAQGALDEYLGSTAEERRRLEQQRDEAAAAVPPTALSTFTRVARKHEGEAMAEVIRLHPKREEYACGGCHMTLTLERVYALRSRDEIQLCDACGRMLYVGSAEGTAG